VAKSVHLIGDVRIEKATHWDPDCHDDGWAVPIPIRDLVWRMNDEPIYQRTVKRSIVVDETEWIHTDAPQTRKRATPEVSCAKQKEIRSISARETVEQGPLKAGDHWGIFAI
jgi:hypothetical protein